MKGIFYMILVKLTPKTLGVMKISANFNNNKFDCPNWYVLP